MANIASFFKKRSNSGKDKDAESSKRQRRSKDDSPVEVVRSANPKRIICWNCNGLSVRLKSEPNIKAIQSFILEKQPDVFFLSEVRLPAAHNAGSRKPSTTTTFYRGRIRHTDQNSTADFVVVQKLLDCEECADYKVYFSLANYKYAGTAMFVNTRTTELPINVRYNVQNLDVKKTVHDNDGRVIFAKFPAFSILHTYVPNNGWGPDHFIRRKRWDEAMKSFMKRKKDAGVKVLWIGDLNVAPLDKDLSHPEYFRRQSGKRTAAKIKDGEDFEIGPEYTGQPGCTDAERQQFNDILEEGDMIDVFRKQNPETIDVFSWSSTGDTGGRGMRIDHCISSTPLLPHLGTMSVLSDKFMGSDHCPVAITFKENTDTVTALESSGGRPE